MNTFIASNATTPKINTIPPRDTTRNTKILFANSANALPIIAAFKAPCAPFLPTVANCLFINIIILTASITLGESATNKGAIVPILTKSSDN